MNKEDLSGHTYFLEVNNNSGLLESTNIWHLSILSVIMTSVKGNWLSRHRHNMNDSTYLVV